MKRTATIFLMAVLLVTVFAAGYFTRAKMGSEERLAQAQTPAPTQGKDRSGEPKTQTGSGQGGLTGVIQSLQNGKLIVKVQQAHITGVQPGANLTVDVDQRVEVIRETTVSDLKTGETVTIRGVMDGSRFVARRILVGFKR